MDGVSDIKRDFRRGDWSRVVVRVSLWLIIIVSIVLIVASMVSAKLVINGRAYDSFNRSIDSSSILNPIWLNITDQRYNDTAWVIDNYYNKTQSDNRYIQDESDPIFTAENGTLWVAINSKLNTTDQRYNDTAYINGQLANYLLVTDQRYNDTALFVYLNATTLKNYGNQTLYGDLSIYGNLNVIGSMVNLTVVNQVVNGSILPDLSGLFDLGSPSLVWNNVYANNVFGYLNYSYLQNVPVFLLADDQRYNDTAWVMANYYNKSDIDSLIASVNVTTYITNNITVENNYTTIYNITNNITEIYNITNNITEIYNITNNITYNITNNITEIYNITYNITNNITEYYNDSLLQSRIDAVNTTQNIMSLGFYNSTLLDYLLDLKLNITDQRYNDTAYCDMRLLDYYNKTEVDYLLLNITVNLSDYYNKTEIDSFLDLKLNISDQRYNDTAWVLANYYNMSESDARYIQNESDPIYSADKPSIVFFINTSDWDKNVSDDFNGSWYALSDVPSGFADGVDNDTLYYFSAPYLSMDAFNNVSVNESMLNFTISEIARNKKSFYNVTLYNTSTNISSINISYLITRIAVYTTDNNYRVQVQEYPSGAVIERDLIPHNGNWIIEKNYAINSQVNITVTGTGTYNVSIEYLSNGVY